MRVDSEHVEPSLRTLQHMTIEDELVLVAKNYIRQVLSLSLFKWPKPCQYINQHFRGPWCSSHFRIEDAISNDYLFSSLR